MDSVTDLTCQFDHTELKRGPHEAICTIIKRLRQQFAGGKTLVFALSAILTSATTAHASSREKIDIVYMQNGDKITCEIRSLEQGNLPSSLIIQTPQS